jgi:hypothetical protein
MSNKINYWLYTSLAAIFAVLGVIALKHAESVTAYDEKTYQWVILSVAAMFCFKTLDLASEAKKNMKEKEKDSKNEKTN